MMYIYCMKMIQEHQYLHIIHTGCKWFIVHKGRTKFRLPYIRI